MDFFRAKKIMLNNLPEFSKLYNTGGSNYWTDLLKKFVVEPLYFFDWAHQDLQDLKPLLKEFYANPDSFQTEFKGLHFSTIATMKVGADFNGFVDFISEIIEKETAKLEAQVLTEIVSEVRLG